MFHGCFSYYLLTYANHLTIALVWAPSASVIWWIYIAVFVTITFFRLILLWEYKLWHVSENTNLTGVDDDDEFVLVDECEIENEDEEETGTVQLVSSDKNTTSTAVSNKNGVGVGDNLDKVSQRPLLFTVVQVLALPFMYL